jgi:hypothetical protein
LYFLDSDPHGASVVSFSINRDGSWGEPVRTSTGGNGMIGNNANGSVTAGEYCIQNALTALLTVPSRSFVLARLCDC